MVIAELVSALPLSMYVDGDCARVLKGSGRIGMSEIWSIAASSAKEAQGQENSPNKRINVEMLRY